LKKGLEVVAGVYMLVSRNDVISLPTPRRISNRTLHNWLKIAILTSICVKNFDIERGAF